MLVACLGKIAYEAVTGNLLFVDPGRGAFLPLPWVHAAGALLGGLIAASRAAAAPVCHGTSRPVRPAASREF
jgi:hypothetical protein